MTVELKRFDTFSLAFHQRVRDKSGSAQPLLFLLAARVLPDVFRAIIVATVAAAGDRDDGAE